MDDVFAALKTYVGTQQAAGQVLEGVEYAEGRNRSAARRPYFRATQVADGTPTDRTMGTFPRVEHARVQMQGYDLGVTRAARLAARIAEAIDGAVLALENGSDTAHFRQEDAPLVVPDDSAGTGEDVHNATLRFAVTVNRNAPRTLT